MADRRMRAAAVSTVEFVARQSIQLLLTAVLARLLTPSDFGVVAVALALVTALGAVADLGARIYVVRVRELDGAALAASYGIVVSTGAVISVGTALTAHWFAGLSEATDFPTVLRALSVMPLLSAVNGVSTGLLIRSLRFGALALVTGVSTAAGGLAAVVLALRDPGPWPLVLMALVTTALGAVLATVLVRPGRLVIPSTVHVQQVLRFGGWVACTMVLDAVATRVPLFVVGLRSSPGATGQLSRADLMAQAFREGTDSAVGRVALPVLAHAEDDEVFVGGMQDGIRFGMALVGPSMMLVSASATPLVLLLFGDQWREAGAILSALAVGVVVWPIHVVTVNALFARGMSRGVFFLDLRNKAIFVALAVIGLIGGPVGVAWGVSTAHVIAAVLNMRQVARHVDYPLGAQLRDSAPFPVVAAPWTLGGWWLASVWDGPPLLVAVCILCGGGLGILLTARLMRIPILMDGLARLRAMST